MDSISFIGGDKRNYYLAKFYNKQKSVYTCYLGDNKLNLDECINKSKYIVLPIPFTKDDKYIYTPLVDEKVSVDYIIDKLKDKTIICGGIKEGYVNILSRNRNTIIDIMKNDYVVIQNTIPTAEGIIKIIIENTPFTIDSCNIAVIGFGRVGKRTCKLLDALNANIFCYDIKKEEVANIRLCSYNVLRNICDKIDQMNIIINTVPKLILTRDVLKNVQKSTLVIDVASNPGGVAYEYAKRNSIQVIHALGIPGIVAPKTSAMYIKEELDKFIIWGVKYV